jgi:hypothetical protein
MALRVGNREVIKQDTLLIPQGEMAVIPVSFGGSDIEVTISYQDDQSGKQDILLSNDNNRMNLVLQNWNNAVGTGMRAPFDLARNEHGHFLSIMIANWRISDMNKVDLQFMVG